MNKLLATGICSAALLFASSASSKDYLVEQLIPEVQARATAIMLPAGQTKFVIIPKSHQGLISCILIRADDKRMVAGQIAVPNCDFTVKLQEAGVHLLIVEKELDTADTLMILATH
jgi:hypothetical protein